MTISDINHECNKFDSNEDNDVVLGERGSVAFVFIHVSMTTKVSERNVFPRSMLPSRRRGRFIR